MGEKKKGGSTLGRRGEDLAVAFLRQRGYRIIECNFRTRLGEIDIVADDSGTLVFVEVKSRSTTMFGYPAEAVTATKQRQLSKVALEYLAGLNRPDVPARFDVVAILMGKKPEIELIRNAFELCYG